MQKAVIGLFAAGCAAAWGQTNATQGNAPQNGAAVDRASAYYHYALAHMYAEMAAEPGGREYIDRAVENYKSALKDDPGSAAISEELADFYVQAGLLGDAEKDAQAALAANPKDLSALRLLARIYTSQIGGPQNRVNPDMLRNAIEQYKKITGIEPKDVDAWVMLGRLEKAAQDNAESEKAYKKALEVDPDNEDALTGLSLVYLDLGNSQAAADTLRQLADKNPSARSLTALAETYEQMKEYGLAAEALKKVLAMNPPNAGEIKQALAQDLVYSQKYADALQIYQGLVDDDPTDAQSYLRISQIYRQQRKFNDARTASDKALAIDPANMEIRYNQVTILEAEGKTQQAIQTLKDILDSTAKKTYTRPEKAVRATLLPRLAALYRDMGQTDLAVDSLRQWADLDPEQAQQAASEIVNTYRVGHEFTKAQQEADADLKKWPDDRDLHMNHASLMADLGKNDQATAEVKKLMDGKSDREIYLALADLYNEGHKYDDAGKALDSAEKLSPSDEEKEYVWFARGAMLEKMKKIEASEAEFRKVLKADPDGPLAANALNYIGYVLADRNTRLTESLDLITKALQLSPENGAYLDSLGWVYFRLGRLPEAEENLRKAVAKTSSDPTVHDHLAQVLMAESKVQEAIQQWQSSLKNWDAGPPAELEPAEVAKVKSNLETAKNRLAKEAKQK
jgi:tetratricopeptide (TPR) repeat protein